MTKQLIAVLLFSLTVSQLTLAAPAAGQEPFYRGKTIRLIVGSTPGGFYDRWARMFAKAMPKYIPAPPR